uniref:Uncharacterized protein n=2 Tax=Plectus sambesii TaxID=2011161 RepID=A0A914XQW0_9BILA
MLLSTQYGYLLVVHELDLDKLGEDMRGFKPNTYWISIETRSLFPPGREHLKRFTADRNRTELIIDFPRGCDPDHISCISPHPHGWAVAGRMNNTDDRSEWTTVHDLQLPAQETLNDDDDDGQSKGADFTPMDVDSSSAARGRPQSEHRRSTVIHLRTERRPGSSYAWAESDSSSSSDDDAIPSPYGELVRRNRWSRTHQSNWSFGVGATSSPQSLLAPTAPSTSSEQQPSSTNTSRDQPTAPPSRGPRLRIINSINPQRPGRTVVIFGGRDPPAPSASSGGNPGANDDSPSAPKTYRRLTYFKEEPRQGRGFIKELCWAPNGRVIASPYAFGCRLLAFDDGCRELCDIHWRGTSAAQPLTEIKSLVGDEGHSDVVLCARFSPVHDALLATGCLQGKVAFYQPKL